MHEPLARPILQLQVGEWGTKPLGLWTLGTTVASPVCAGWVKANQVQGDIVSACFGHMSAKRVEALVKLGVEGLMVDDFGKLFWS